MLKVSSISLFVLICFVTIGFAQVSGTLTLEKDKFYAGEDTNMELNVVNHAFTDIENILIVINKDDAVGGKWQRSLEILASRTSYTKNIDVQSYEDSESGIYNITGTVSFVNEEVETNAVAVEILDFPILTETELLDAEDRDGKVLTVSIRNTANYNLYNVSLVVEIPQDFEFNATSLGPMETDSFFPTQELSKEYYFNIPGGVSGPYHIKLELVFDDSMGHHMKTDAVDVSLGGGLGTVELILGIIIILLIAVFASKRL